MSNRQKNEFMETLKNLIQYYPFNIELNIILFNKNHFQKILAYEND